MWVWRSESWAGAGQRNCAGIFLFSETLRARENTQNISGFAAMTSTNRPSRGQRRTLPLRGELREPGDLYYLDLEELQSLLRTGKADRPKIERRRVEYRRFARLTPPRLMFSDGEAPEPDRRDGLPAGALTGLGVSVGIVEGRARVVRSLGEVIMEKGDILVTAFTDPSRTPVFVSISGLVTEVGGMMTHGAVITREYGLPAVVGVADATRLIHDGDRIRLDGEMGFVQILLN